MSVTRNTVGMRLDKHCTFIKQFPASFRRHYRPTWEDDTSQENRQNSGVCLLRRWLLRHRQQEARSNLVSYRFVRKHEAFFRSLAERILRLVFKQHSRCLNDLVCFLNGFSWSRGQEARATAAIVFNSRLWSLADLSSIGS